MRNICYENNSILNNSSLLLLLTMLLVNSEVFALGIMRIRLHLTMPWMETRAVQLVSVLRGTITVSLSEDNVSSAEETALPRNSPQSYTLLCKLLMIPTLGVNRVVSTRQQILGHNVTVNELNVLRSTYTIRNDTTKT